ARLVAHRAPRIANRHRPWGDPWRDWLRAGPALAAPGLLRLRRTPQPRRADDRLRTGGHRDVRVTCRIDAAVRVATTRLRPGVRLGTVRRDAGGRDGAGHLLQRGIRRPAG